MPSGITQIFQSKLTDVDTIQRDILGVIRQEGNKWYKYVAFKNTTATVAGAAGTLVAYNAATGYLNNVVVADFTDADAIVIPAGVTLATVTGTAGTTYYCWVQIKGLTTLDTSISSAAVGKGFYVTTTDRTAAVGAAYYDYIAGICTDGTTGAILTCPF